MITHNEGRTQKLTLRELRERSGLTRAQVAKKLDVDLSCVTHWELGDWRPLRKYHKKLAKMYGVTVDELLESNDGQ
nr:MAG TPA: Helix-turn-helix XRE-family like protein [Caudoviricetes sp.]